MKSIRQGSGRVFSATDTQEMNSLSAFLEKFGNSAKLLEAHGQSVHLPHAALVVLREAVETMSEGKAVTVAPVDTLLTTQEVADILGVSRPTITKLIDEGHLAGERPKGRKHRRVRLQAVLDYQAHERKERAKALDALVAEASATGLYDDDAGAYQAALRQARKQPSSGC